MFREKYNIPLLLPPDDPAKILMDRVKKELKDYYKNEKI